MQKKNRQPLEKTTAGFTEGDTTEKRNNFRLEDIFVRMW
jgi:hypothetical protein